MKRLVYIFCLLLISCSSNKEIFNSEPESKNPLVSIYAPVQTDTYETLHYKNSHAKPNIAANYEYKNVFEKSYGSADKDLNIIMAPPLVVNNILYTIDAHAKLTATDLNTFKILWTEKLCKAKDDFKSGGLVMSKDILFVTLGNGKVFAINPQDGKALWQQQIPGQIKSAPIADDKNIYIQTTSNDIFSLSQKEGKKIFSFKGIGESLGHPLSSSPSIKGQDIVIGMSSGSVYLLKKETGTLIWGAKNYSTNLARTGMYEKNIVASPVFDDKNLYVSGLGNLMAKYNITSGKVLWKKEISSIKTPIVSGNTIFTLTTSNNLMALNKDTGATIWENDLSVFNKSKKNPITFSDLCLVNDKLLAIGNDYYVYEFSTNSGKVVKKKYLGNTTLIEPVCLSDKLIILTPQANIAIYK